MLRKEGHLLQLLQTSFDAMTVSAPPVKGITKRVAEHQHASIFYLHTKACLGNILEVRELVAQGLFSPGMGGSSGLGLSPGGLSSLEPLVAAPQAGHLPLQLLYPLPAPHPFQNCCENEWMQRQCSHMYCMPGVMACIQPSNADMQ